MAAVRLRRVFPNERGLVLGGALSVLFGLVLVVAPGTGALAVVWKIAASREPAPLRRLRVVNGGREVLPIETKDADQVHGAPESCVWR